MAKSRARLHVVGGSDRPAGEADPQQLIDVVLRELFRTEATLRHAADECRRQIEAARSAYGKAHGLMALPRVELLRTRYGPKVERP